MQCKKNLTVEDNQKRMNIANFKYIYTNIYTYIICDENESNKNDSINSTLQHGRVVDKNCLFDPVCQTVQIEGSYHLLAIRAKGNYNI